MQTERTVYGCRETFPLPESERGKPCTKHVAWTAKGLRITRLRLLSDPGFPLWDVSYCWGILDGEKVRVILPFDQLPKRGMSRAIVQHAQRDGVYAKGIGILDAISTCC